ncbi:hypothetical protein GCM10022222_00860 [Amycolatopsis ultiminotia]|uniref:Uncharacterized protein n=1 Tax=Amycolatopsis ultiminotia TaxID=543629 RepID=A0ABP6UX68_9PSEU
MLALIAAVAAGICLGLGWLLGQVVLVYVALGVSATGFVLVLVEALRRRKAAKAAEAAATADEAEPEEAEAGDADDDEVDANPVEQQEDPVDERGDVLPVATVEDGEVVFVVPGRMRFHLAGCRLLEGRDAEQLTLDEAEDEKFTACTVCANHAAAELVGG